VACSIDANAVADEIVLSAPSASAAPGAGLPLGDLAKADESLPLGFLTEEQDQIRRSRRPDAATITTGKGTR